MFRGYKGAELGFEPNQWMLLKRAYLDYSKIQILVLKQTVGTAEQEK